MNNNIKYYSLIKNLNLQNGKAVSEILNKKGFFSNSGMFPLPSLQFELTSHCNAFCKHCYNNSGVNNKKFDDMTPSKWIEFSKYLVEKGGIFECIISGGETLLLGEDLFRIMDILHNNGTLFLLITNGSLLTEDIARRLKKYRYHWLQVSIDGVNAKYHDSFRNTIGSWERAINAALSVSSNNIPLKIDKIT